MTGTGLRSRCTNMGPFYTPGEGGGWGCLQAAPSSCRSAMSERLEVRELPLVGLNFGQHRPDLNPSGFPYRDSLGRAVAVLPPRAPDALHRLGRTRPRLSHEKSSQLVSIPTSMCGNHSVCSVPAQRPCNQQVRSWQWSNVSLVVRCTQNRSGVRRFLSPACHPHPIYELEIWPKPLDELVGAPGLEPGTR